MPLEIVNYITAPDARGKFVTLVSREDSDDGIILFSDFTQDFQHADIVRRWRATAPAALAANHKVTGGGWWRMENATLVLYGQSSAYGRFDPAWIRSRLKAGSVLTESRVDVL